MGRCNVNARKSDGPSWTFGKAYYPTLWGTDRFYRFCTEAPRPVDPGTSAYFPYCPLRATPRLPYKPDRRYRAVFIGSATKHRKRLLAAAARTGGVVVRLLASRSHNLSKVADKELMRDAVYTLCPSGDTPESQRVYQAIQRGSVPLVTDRFQFPFAPSADWHTFSAPLCVEADGTLGLPDKHDRLLLQRSVHAHAAAFDCEPTNPYFIDFVARALRVFAGWLPASSRAEPASPWETPRPAAESASRATAGPDLGPYGELSTNENWRACPARRNSVSKVPATTQVSAVASSPINGKSGGRGRNPTVATKDPRRFRQSRGAAGRAERHGAGEEW